MITDEVFLTAKLLAAKLGTTVKTLHVLSKGETKYLTVLSNGTFLWPAVKHEWEAYRMQRMKPRPTKGELEVEKEFLEVPKDLNFDEAHFSQEEQSDNDIAKRKKDLNNLSIGEQIIEGLKHHIDGVENSSFHWSRALNESIKARTSMLEMLEMESKTLKREEVETWLYNTSRQNRDMWLNWPQRVATEMAEQLGVDARLMNDLLMESVRKNLERNGTLPAGFGNYSGEGISEGAEATTQT